MSNKFETDINLNNTNSFDVNEFIGNAQSKSKTQFNVGLYADQKRKIKEIADREYGGNMQNFFQDIIKKRIDKEL